MCSAIKPEIERHTFNSLSLLTYNIVVVSILNWNEKRKKQLNQENERLKQASITY